MTDAQDTPIACTLSGADFDERLAWIAEVNREGLRSFRREGASLHLLYDAAVRERVHELVRKESACCAFLAFAVADTGDGVAVTITVPDRAREHAGQLFEAFQPAAGAADE